MTIEFPTDPDAICQTLYNTESTCSRCIGYCTFHKGYITRKQLKTKQCLQKNCDALIKNQNHEFWIEREQKREEIKRKRIEEKRIEKEKLSKFHLITENQKKKNIHIREKRFICLDLKFCKLTGKQKKSMKGVPYEVIQIGAVMLDEKLNYISQFSTFVKPIYGVISEETVDNFEFYEDRLDHADTFSTAFYKLYTWAGSNQDDVITLCWSNSVYTQLWDEIFIKAQNHYEYRDFLKTFVDLQDMLGYELMSKKQISFDAALKYCHIKFDGLRDSALSHTLNQARIFNKLMKHNKKTVEFNPLWKYTETDLSKHFYTSNSHTNDFTSSFAAFMSKDLLEQFIQQNETADTKAKAVTINKTPAYISKLFSCSKYGINVSTWLKFSTRMLFIRDNNYSKLVGKNI